MLLEPGKHFPVPELPIQSEILSERWSSPPCLSKLIDGLKNKGLTSFADVFKSVAKTGTGKKLVKELEKNSNYSFFISDNGAMIPGDSNRCHHGIRTSRGIHALTPLKKGIHSVCLQETNFSLESPHITP
ncbi:hypothetical protein Moror_7765 [Moniliophthora roreri MCA 2997]|uniref:Uncharacterized protein n=1 Tax=Moniliophthora roreri (strain MCA 2997) TaxID=1381753 RepID=V2XBL4_MONRO|nr:hypothetical protein Moror_7765 [Moniliophthora roreri MCA 2997]